MPSSASPACRHIMGNGTQCGSPALRKKEYCFYHQQSRPWKIECYSEGKYATGEILLPFFEDAHSIQAVVREVVQMVLQKRIEQKTASLVLYALQIASSNLKRMELEKPQPERVVTAVEMEADSKFPMAPLAESTAKSKTTASEPEGGETEVGETEIAEPEIGEPELPPGTIQACHQPSSRPDPRTGTRTKPRLRALQREGEDVTIQ